MEPRMEADWEAQIGPGLPQIHVPWEGFGEGQQGFQEAFVDLRSAPWKLHTIVEAAHSPALASALAALNSEASPVFTAKSDRWSTDQADIDPYEFAALPEDARCGAVSYIDIVERDLDNLISFPFHENRARQLVAYLREQHRDQGRIDLVIRAATVDGRAGYGITLYTAGCGADTVTAQANWEAVLATAVLATIGAVGRNSPPHPTRASSSIG
jgi:hypothetical protein